MERLFACAVVASLILLATAGITSAGDETVPAAEGNTFTNVTAHSDAGPQEEPPATGESLTRMLRDYKPGETAGKPDDENKHFDVETDRTITYDAKKIFRHKSGTGYQKQKKDFADPKKLMNK